MDKGPRLTRLVHEMCELVIEPGDIVVDATAGNGHDTLALARLVGETGRVFAFDVQHRAHEQTARRLADHGFTDRVTLVARGHQRMRQSLPPATQGQVAVVVFNLGYLPGGDKLRITLASSTLPALDQATGVLKEGGLLTVVAYPGHQGGDEEYLAVEQWFKRQPAPLREIRIVDPEIAASPVLFSGRK